MVFCGKPSKGCANCRVRRIKCDQFNPACSQCIRAGKECPGYRDQLALLFRDENDKVVRKARTPNNATEKRKPQRKAGNAKSAVTTPQGSETYARANCSTGSDAWPASEWSWIRAQLSQVVPPYQMPVELNPPGTFGGSEDPGISFFFEHYVTVVLNFSSGPMNQRNGCVLPVWPQLFKDRMFYDAVSSVGFAGLSNVTKNESHMIVARNKYVATLGRINTLLQDPRCDLESTFRTVMLLAAFEIVNGQSDGMWGVHIDGAAALLRSISLRPRQPGTKEFRLQLQFCCSCFIKCISKREAPPIAIVEWCRQNRHSLSEDDFPALPLIDIISRFVGIYVSFKECNYSNTEAEYGDLVTLEAELELWESQLPDSWRFRTEVVLDSSLAETTFNGQCHVYSDLWTSRVLNHYRWARILINELIAMHIDRMASPSTEEGIQQRRSLAIINQVATDICTSVSTQLHRHTLINSKRNKVPPVSVVFILLFPLAVAGGALGVSEELHNWAIKVLGVIGNTMGIQQALTLIPVAKTHRERWKVGHRIYSSSSSDIEF